MTTAALAAAAPNGSSGGASSAAATQVAVRFVTRLPLEYRVPDEPVVSRGQGDRELLCNWLALAVVFFKHMRRLTSPFDPTSLSEKKKKRQQQTVPTNLARYGLSQIINHLLGRGVEDDDDEEVIRDDEEGSKKKKKKKKAAVVPFDFLVGGELVRRPLDALLRAQGASAETAVHVEYFLAVPPPTPAPPAPADDWVDALVAIPRSSNSS